MSGVITYLLNELPNLIAEAKKKEPEIKQGIEKALDFVKLAKEQQQQSSDSASTTAILTTDEWATRSEEVLWPPLLEAVASAHQKLAQLALPCVQKYVQALPLSIHNVEKLVRLLEAIIQAEQSSLPMDTQLKFLQIITPLITTNKEYTIRGELLAKLLCVCFRVQEISKGSPIVQQTASATIRQLLIYLFEKVDTGNTAQVADAHAIFEDLCLLSAADQPQFLTISTLPRAFGLELIESILANNHRLFKETDILKQSLSDRLCPLLIRTSSVKNDFPNMVRLTRVIVLLLKHYHTILVMQGEIFLSMLTKMLESDATPWQRALILEACKQLLTDPQFAIWLYSAYDQAPEATSLLSELLNSFWRVASENPSWIVATVGDPKPQIVEGSSPTDTDPDPLPEPDAAAAESMDMTMLGSVTSSSKVALLDQLEKAEPPAFPDTYLIYLALQCTVLVSKCVSQKQHNAPEAMLVDIWPCLLRAFRYFSTAWLDDETFHQVLGEFVALLCTCSVPHLREARHALLFTLCRNALPSFSDKMIDHTSNNPTNQSNSANTQAQASANATQTQYYLTDKMVASLLAILEVAKYLRDVLEGDWYLVLETFHSAEQLLSGKAAGGRCVMVKKLGPSAVVANSAAAATALVRRQPSTLTDSAVNAIKAAASAAAAGLGSGPPSATNEKNKERDLPSAASPSDFDAQAVLTAIKTFFENTSLMEEEVFHHFLFAYCRLCIDSIGVSDHVATAALDGDPLNHRGLAAQGLIPKFTTKTFEVQMLLSRLREYIVQNMDRFTAPMPSPGWAIISDYLIVAASTAPSNTHRSQVCEMLVELMTSWSQKVDPAQLKEHDVLQKRILETIHRMNSPVKRPTATDALPSPVGLAPPTNLSYGRALSGNLLNGSGVGSPVSSSYPAVNALDCQKAGLEALTKLLQTNGHCFTTGWPLLLSILRQTCSNVALYTASPMLGSTVAPAVPAGETAPLSLNTAPTTTVEGDSATAPSQSSTAVPAASKLAQLVRIAFGCLKLVCTDYLSLLDDECMRMCIDTLGSFGTQKEDLNISLTSVGLLWNVSDHLRTKKKERLASSPVALAVPTRSSPSSKAASEERLAADTPETTELPSEISLSPEALDALWMSLLLQLNDLCADNRSEVRNSANQTLFRTISIQGANLNPATWEAVLWKIVFVLLDAIKTEESRKEEANTALYQSSGALVRDEAVEKQWDETRVLILGAVAKIFRDNLLTLLQCADFDRAWVLLLKHLKHFCLYGNQSVAKAASLALRTLIGNPSTTGSSSAGGVSSLAGVNANALVKPVTPGSSPSSPSLPESGLTSPSAFGASLPAPAPAKKIGVDFAKLGSQSPALRSRLVVLLTQAWETWEKIGLAIVQERTTSMYPQDALIAFIGTLGDLSIAMSSNNLMTLEIYLKVAIVVRGIVSYEKSRDFPSDADHMTHLQNAVLDFLMNPDKLNREIAGVPSLLIRELAAMLPLAFERGCLATLGAVGTKKRNLYGHPTYIALCYKVMTSFSDVWQQMGDREELYSLGAMSEFLKSLIYPLSKKYDCPNVDQTFGSDQLLWKQALRIILELMKKLPAALANNDATIITATMNHVVTSIHAFLTSTSAPAMTQTSEEREENEILSMRLIELCSGPFLLDMAKLGVHEDVIKKLLQSLGAATVIQPEEHGLAAGASSLLYDSATQLQETEPTMTLSPVGMMEPNESQVSYQKCQVACLKALFRLCSAEATEVNEHEAIALLAVPILMQRCRDIIASYTEKKSLHGKMPLTSQETDTVYLLLHLLCDFKARPGLLANAFQPRSALSSPPQPLQTQLSAVSQVGVTTPVIPSALQTLSSMPSFSAAPSPTAGALLNGNSFVAADGLEQTLMLPMLSGPCAHLFYLYRPIVSLLSLDAGSLETETMAAGMSLHQLVQDCLRKIGEALGVWQLSYF